LTFVESNVYELLVLFGMRLGEKRMWYIMANVLGTKINSRSVTGRGMMMETGGFSLHYFALEKCSRKISFIFELAQTSSK